MNINITSTKSIEIAAVVVMAALVAFPALAQIKPVDCGGLDLGIKCAQGDNVNTAKSYIVTIVNILLALAGITAAIFLIIGGVRYIVSQGERDGTEKAKNTILYAVIGLIVIGLSAAIVNFVIGPLAGGGGGQQNNQPPPGNGGGNPPPVGGGVGLFWSRTGGNLVGAKKINMVLYEHKFLSNFRGGDELLWISLLRFVTLQFR